MNNLKLLNPENLDTDHLNEYCDALSQALREAEAEIVKRNGRTVRLCADGMPEDGEYGCLGRQGF